MKKKSHSRRKRQYDPVATRGRILDVASDEFQKRGYHATSMHDLMRLADVPGGSVYHYFPTKKSLALAVIEERVANIVARTWIDPVRAASSASAGIMAVFDSVAQSIGRDGAVSGCPLNNLVLELSLADQDFQSALLKVFDLWRQGIARRFRDDIKAGIVRSIDPERLATFVVALFSGSMSMAKAAQNGSAIRECREELVRLLPVPKGR